MNSAPPSPAVSPVAASLTEARVQVREHKTERFEPRAMLLVRLHNPSDAPATPIMGPVEVTDEHGKRLATGKYQRGVVWEDALPRRKLQALHFPLAPGETVQVKLFYALSAVPADEPLHLVARIGATEVKAGPVRLDVVGAEL